MTPGKVLVVCLNPALQKTLELSRLQLDSVNRLPASHLDAAGKGMNVARVLAQLRQPAVQLTQVGGGQREVFVSLAARDGVDLCWVDSRSEMRFCYTVVETEARRATELVEESEPVAPGTEAALRRKFSELCARCAWVTLSGSRAPGFSKGLYAEWTAEAKRCGCRVVVDLRGEDLKLTMASGADYIKPNYKEFVSTFLPNEALDDRDAVARVREKMRELATRTGASVIVTRGEQGALWSQGDEALEQATRPVVAVSATGSGDAFTAGLVWALDRGLPLGEAVAEAQRCGALNALQTRPGQLGH